MKNLFKLFAVAVVVLSFASCATYQKQAPIMGINSNTVNTYVKADLDYKNAKKVEGKIESKKLFGFINLNFNGDKTLKSTNRYRNLTKTEAQALYRAKELNNVDIILEPEFERETHSWFFGAYKKEVVIVKGWGINIKGIKEDTMMNPHMPVGGGLFN
ncbi:MAG: hypothetical protein IJF06_02160 [Bacteroidaceae bacterium]|nr:hypothetical protein [Bacteroidaceae bacterium]MBR4066617.1 hypothetical protein [Bacteroidaceae bacterium]